MWNSFAQIFKIKLKEISTYKNTNSMMKLKKSSKRSVPIHRKYNWSEFYQVKELLHYAVHLTFNLQEQPCTLYIPRQPQDTTVYKYQDRPVIRHNCHKYGHTKTRCRRKGVCRNFWEDDHTSDKTNKFPNESTYANCGGHMAKSTNVMLK